MPTSINRGRPLSERELDHARSGKSLIERAVARFSVDAARPAPQPVPPQPASPPGPRPQRTTSRLVTIDFDRLRAQGYLVPGEHATIVEEIRLIKRPVLRLARSGTGPAADRARLVMVTSALPQEGKTFLALNLALSMALEHDTTVLLVDTDIWQRSVQRVLGFEAERGFFDLIADETLDMSEVLIRTSLDKLTILPPGRDHPGANELLASARMAQIMDEISRRYPDRIVLFDTPPALVRTETGVLATHVGQVILVVGAGETSDAAMREALELVKDGPRVGLVMNKLHAVYRTERFGHVYGAYYRPRASHATSGT